MFTVFVGQIPVVPLNFAAISQETSMERDTVEGCVREMLQALSRSVQAKKNVEFIFPSIGKLSIKDSRVKMKFYKDFLQDIDGSGALVNAMRNVSLFIGNLCSLFPPPPPKVFEWSDSSPYTNH